jgi:hypothetical protein
LKGNGKTGYGEDQTNTNTAPRRHEDKTQEIGWFRYKKGGRVCIKGVKSYFKKG